MITPARVVGGTVGSRGLTTTEETPVESPT
jgi:hypothetical protein